MITLAGLAQITAQVQVMQPLQLSAVQSGKRRPPGTFGALTAFMFETAQVKTLLSIDLLVLDAITPLANAVLDLATSLTNFSGK